MTEEVSQSASEATPPQPASDSTAAQTQSDTLLASSESGNSDAPSWRDGLSEELRGKYPDLKTPEDVFKSYVEISKQYSSGEKIVKPADDASDELKAAYKERLQKELYGEVEEGAYDYAIADDVPEEIKTVMSEGGIDKYKAYAQENNIPPDVFKGLVDLYVGEQVEAHSRIDEFTKEHVDSIAADLQKEFGDNYSERISAAASVAKLIDPAIVESAQYANDPVVIKILDWAAQNVSTETEGKIREQMTNSVSTPEGLRAQAKELTEKSVDGTIPIDKRNEYAAQARELYQRIQKLS